MRIQQLPLLLKWPEHMTFQNFVVGQNRQLFEHLSAVVEGNADFCTYAYSLSSGIGLTHLLQATCQAFTERDRSAVYLSFKSIEVSPEILEGLESIKLVCLDDIECLEGNPEWESSVFHLYHRLQGNGGYLLIGSHGLPKSTRWSLADLRSRFLAAAIFQLQSLSDEDKFQVLKQRAKSRGLDLSEEVGKYLLHRCPRDIHKLMEILEKLDIAALAAQRRLTVPFVKEVL